MPRAMVWKHSFGALGHLQWLAVGLAGSLYLGITRRHDESVRLCSLLIVLGLVSFFVQKAGDGVANNAQFELVFAVSIGVGLAFAQAPRLPLAQRYSPEALRILFLLALCLRLAASARLEPVRFFTDRRFHAELAAREAAMAAKVSCVQSTAGDVACNPLACYRAGKPFVVDAFSTRQRILAGQLPPDAFCKLIISGRVTTVD
jgi:hypothetical protein